MIGGSDGNFYTATSYGGRWFCGAVIKFTPNFAETVLYSSRCGPDGNMPVSNLVQDAAGNLYGTTISGDNASCDGTQGCATVFELTPDGTKTTLYSFTGGADGDTPYGTLVLDASGNIYSTAA